MTSTTILSPGVYTFTTVTIENGGTLLLQGDAGSGTGVTIFAESVEVQAGGHLSADGQGYAPNGNGPGGGANANPGYAAGGGHGSEGGSASVSGGRAYGSVTEPVELGSEGGYGVDWGVTYAGSGGGGAIRLVVAGTLTLSGTLSANGVDVGAYGGAGAGGSVWVSAGTLAGSGLIQANGGNNTAGTGGGGAGGRIAVHYDASSFPVDVAHVQAYGGSGYQAGGVGTIFEQAASANPAGVLWILNDPARANQPAVFYAADGARTFDQVIVGNNATLLLKPEIAASGLYTEDVPFTLQANAITVETGGRISADGQGYQGTVGDGYGPGGGTGTTSWAQVASGGGYGSVGGSGSAAGGSAYGSITEPEDLGSAGGSGHDGAVYYGGAGGGAIRLVVTDTLTVEGSLTANGLGSWARGGGGSGGSLWITAGTLAGNGLIQANGGSDLDPSDGGGGGGAGGRIALEYTTLMLPLDAAHVQAYGVGSHWGGVGTIFWRAANAAPGGVLWISNDPSNANQPTMLSEKIAGPAAYDQVIVGANATLLLVPHNDGDTDYTDARPFALQANTVTIESGGQLSADGQGYQGTVGDGYGPGGGTGTTSWAQVASGGGYGSVGGSGSAAGGSAYGSITEPEDLGSAGGSGHDGAVYYGGAGGGAIRLVVTDTLTVEGSLTANGLGSWARGGGGSGGSLWITAGTLAGNGLIQANGGSDLDPSDGGGGGGAGGRIAIYYGGTFPISLTVQALGAGSHWGGDGTVYLESTSVSTNTSTIEGSPDQVVADGMAAGVITVTLKSGSGQPMANKPVSVGLVSGSQAYVNGQLVVPQTMLADVGTTDASGVATAVITATIAGERVLRARSGSDTIQDNATVLFVAGPPDAARSSVDVSSGTAPADGTTPVTVTVTLRDAFNNPVPDAAVVISTTGQAQVTQPTSATNADGQVTGVLTDASGETITVSAQGGAVPIAQTQAIRFMNADISLAEDGPAAVGLGQPITYTLTVRNTDWVAAQNIAVTDTLPAEVTYLSDTAPVTATQSSGTLVWHLGVLAPGGQITFQLSGLVSAQATRGAQVTNRATATTTNTEERLDNNAAEVTTALVGANLAVSQSGPGWLGVGQPVTYSLVLRNQGLAEARPVVITDILPAEVSYIANTAPVSATAQGQTLVWNVDSLAPGATLAFTVAGQVDPWATPLTVATNTVAAQTASPEEPTSINLAALALPVRAPDLGISKTGPGAVRARAGQPVTYTLTVANTGLVGASGVVLTDTLPDGLAYVGDTAPAAVRQAGQTLSWPLGQVAAGATVSFDLHAAVTAAATAGQVTAEPVVVMAAEADENPLNNQLVFTTTLLGAVDSTASSLSVAPAQVAADGQTPALVTLVIRDVHQHALADVPVTLTLASPSGQAHLAMPLLATAGAGVLTATVTDANVEQVIVSAVAADVPLSQTATINFVPGPTDATQSILAVAPASAVANSVDVVTATVTLRDAFDRPLAGHTVRLSASGTGNTVSPANAPSDADGQATFTLVSTYAETKTVAAVDDTDGVTFGAAPVAFTAGPVDAARSTLSAARASAPADGITPITLTVKARDIYSNPVPGVAVTVTASGSAAVVQPAALTDAAGQAFAGITDATRETVTLTASAGGQTLGNPLQVSFLGADVAASLRAVAMSNSGWSGDTALTGFPLTYSLMIQNVGLLPAENVVVTDVITPDGVYSAVTENSGYPFQLAGSVATWQLGELAPGRFVLIDLAGQVGAPAGSVMTNTLAAATSSPEQVLANNTAQIVTAVDRALPVLSVSPTGPTLVVGQGGSAAVTETVGNVGLADLSGLTLTLPRSIPWLTADVLGTQPTLTVGASTVFTLTVQPDAAQTPGYYRDFVNVTDAQSGQRDIALTVQVRPPLRTLAVTVHDDQGQLVPGAAVSVQKQAASVKVTQGITETYYLSAQSTADAAGQVAFADLDVGNYSLWVTAPQHAFLSGTLVLTAGSGTQAVDATLTALPQLSLSPAQPVLTVLPGQTAAQALTIHNGGAAPLTGLSLTPPANVPWVYFGAPSPLPDIGPGESLDLSLFASPPISATDGVYQDYIGVSAAGGLSAQAAVTVKVSPLETRDLAVSVAPSGGGSGQAVGGGQLTLIQQDLTAQVTNGITKTFNAQFNAAVGTDGTATFAGLKPGAYNYQLTAAGYEQGTGSLTVAARGPQDPAAQAITLTLQPNPFSFNWQVSPIQQAYAITLTMTYDVSSPKPALVIPERDWVFGAQSSQTLGDNITLYNPTSLPVTLTGLAVTAPGVQVTIPQPYNPTVPAGGSRDIPVDVTKTGAVGRGAVVASFSYQGTPDNYLGYTLNPSSQTSDWLDSGTSYTGTYALAPVLTGTNPSVQYTLQITQPASLNWAALALSQSGPLTWDSSTNLAATLTVSPPPNLAAGVYTDTMPIHAAGSDGSARDGALALEVTVGADGRWQAHTAFDLGPLPLVTKSSASTGVVIVSEAGAAGGGGGGFVPTQASGGGWVWAPLPGGGGVVGTQPQAAAVTPPSFPQVVPPPVVAVDEQQARLQLNQNVMLEGEGFRATLDLNNTSAAALENASLDLTVLDGAGQPAAGFTITPTVPTDLGAVGAGGTANAAWLLLPSGLNVTDAAGQTYTVTAAIHYDWNGGTYQLAPLPQVITVLPAPDLQITYTLPSPAYACTTFDLRTTLHNAGAGTARNVRFSSAQPQITDNRTGLPLSFAIVGAFLNGQPLGAALDLNVGDIVPGMDAEVVWRLQANARGRFTQFTSDYRQANYVGVPLPPLISQVNTTFADPADPAAQGCLGGLPPSQAFATDECPFCNNAERAWFGGDGVNVYTGNYNEQSFDGGLVENGTVPVLTFERSYNSLTAGNYYGASAPPTGVPTIPTYDDVLGRGWTDNLDLQLTLPDQPGGEANTIILRAPRGSQMRWVIGGNGTYQAYQGVLADLTRDGANYVVFTHSNYRAVFDSDGKLLELDDPKDTDGNYTNVRHFSYNGQGNGQGKLAQAWVEGKAYTLTFGYNGAGLIQSLSDGHGHTATYTYSNGDLTQVTNLMGQTLTYTYENHELTQVTDGSGVVVVRNVYGEQGRVIQQFDGLGNSLLQLSFPDPGNPNVVQVTERGVSTTVTINDQNVVAAVTGLPQGGQTGWTPTGLNPAWKENPLGARTTFAWQGDNLTALTDPLSHTVALAYDQWNNPAVITDARGNVSTQVYTGTLLLASTDALGNTVRYTYTTQADWPQPAGLLKATSTAGGAVTSYAYNALGLRTAVTDTAGLVTTYAYDDLGRVISTTQYAGTAWAQTTVDAYNAAGQVTQTTRNYLPGESQNYRAVDQPGQPYYNLMTSYVYDGAGRVTRTTDTQGHANWTCYDGAGRADRTVANASGDGHSPATDPCDAAHYQPSADPAYDRLTTTTYDANGNAIATTGPDGTVSRTYYDSQNRAVQTVQNLTNWDVMNPQPPTWDPAKADQNVPTQGTTTYDAAGNVTRSVDLAGTVTAYCYDAAGRTVKTVQNPTALNPCIDYTPSGAADQDLINRTIYDENGNAVATIDPAGRVTRTYYDALNRPVVTIQNLTNWAITNPAWPSFDPAHPDQNIGSQTFYDAQGRAYRTADLTRTSGTGNWTCYDDAGRTTRTVTNATVDNPCAAGFTHIGNSDENLITSYVYDDVGRQIATVAPDGKISRTYYTTTGQRLAQVENLSGRDATVDTLPAFDAAHPDQNVTTLWGYDVEGRVVTSTTAAGSLQARTSWTCYDALGRTVKTVQNPSVADPCSDYTPGGAPDQDVIQRTVYDASGRQIATIGPGGADATHPTISRTYYDGLGRALTVTQNLVGQAVTVNVPPTFDPAQPDQNAPAGGATTYDVAGQVTQTTDVTGLATEYGYDGLGRTGTVTILPADGAPIVSRSLYDKLGNVTDRIDPKGIVTHYEYDQQGRLTAVVENYRPGYLANADTNVRTEYGYDAHGNRLTLLDANRHQTTYAYDGLDRLIRETDPLSDTTTYAYDLAGQQVTKTDPNGVTTTSAYDGAHRLAGQSSPRHDADVTFVYDALGNRVAMTDTVGVTRWQYDLAGRATNVTDPFGQVVSYTYGLTGNRTGLTYPDGKAVAYGFDGLNRMQTAAPQAGWNIAGQATYQYDALGQVITATLPNGITTVYGYDGAHRLTTITHRAADGTLLASYAYTLDAAGNRTGVTEVVQQPAITPSGPVTVTVSVRDTGSLAQVGLPVYVFSGTVYLNQSQTTDASGQAAFMLDPGGYRFRSDKNGTQFWSSPANDCQVPGCTGDVVTTTLPLTVTVLDTNGAAQAGLPVYVFNDASYTGFNATTDANGQAVFTLPQGNYHFRSDKNGTQFWSAASNNCGVPGCAGAGVTVTVPLTVSVVDTSGLPQANLPVYAFDGTTYSGYNTTTDPGGQAVFTLPAGSYRFRADENGTQFWSDTANDCTVPGCTGVGVTVTVPVTVTVLDTNGTAQAGLPVYAFDGTTFTGYNQTTDANGQAGFTLPQGSYRFRADRNGTQFWSASNNNCAVPGCTGVGVTVTVPVTVTVLDTNGLPQAGLSVSVFDGTNYTGDNATTDANGQVAFTLPQGNYRFRADKAGTQFWSASGNDCAVPGCTSAAVEVSGPILVTVADTNGAAQAGLPVYVYDGGTSTNFNGTTNADGQVSFVLPPGSYRFRSDKNGTQFWSASANDCTVPGCASAAVTVTAFLQVSVVNTDGAPQAGLPVYAFDGGTYTNFSQTTDGSGQAIFTLPAGNYRFRSDLNGTQFWSDTANDCMLPGCTGAVVTTTVPLTVTVMDSSGAIQAGLPVYVFDGASNTGYNGTTNENGQTGFTLPMGNYHFRSDKNGTQFWSDTANDCAVPGCTSDAITVTQALVVSVVDTSGLAQAGLPVYVFNDASYTGYNTTTDASGQAVFTLPLGGYHFRSDLNGTEFWSSSSNACTLPGCTSSVVTTTVPLTVTVLDSNGAAQAGLPVYAFDGTTYTGYNRTTDASGLAVFTLPQGNYRFRADQGGAQSWSDSVDDCAVPGCAGVTVTLAPTGGMAPNGMLSLTAYQPGSDTAMILASWIMPAGEQIVSDGPVSTQKTTQSETPGLSLSLGNAADSAENPTQTTISYTYDSLYRLTDAVYSNGFEFHYTYDPVGNRLTQTTCTPGVPCSTTTYGYDPANRLTSVNGQTYTWDNNGNLLNDGTSAYAYDSQNRLTSLTQAGHTYGFGYSGNGDRLTQTVDGATTRYALDLEAGLTQVLSDGTYGYLYGVDRLAQVSASETDYFLGDALGSVRQLVDASGAVTLAKNYEPYGSVIDSTGIGLSTYGFDGESQEGALVYLRGRTYSSADARFLTPDISLGDAHQPMNFNAWLFAYGNPTNLVDRDGARPCSEALWLPLGEHEGDFYRWCTRSTPDITSYDETVDPWGITWEGTSFVLPDIIKCPYYKCGPVSPNTDRAQFIANNDRYATEHGWPADLESITASDPTGTHTGLCGLLSTAAILRQACPTCTVANEIVTEFVALRKGSATPWPDEQTAGELATLINKSHKDQLHAWYQNQSGHDAFYLSVADWAGSNDATAYEAMAGTGGLIRQWLSQQTYVIAGIAVDGDTGQLRSGARGGKFAADGVGHWVVITGLSIEWSKGDNWKWVRIYNPFAHRPEYYWWGDFQHSWSRGNGLYNMLRVDRANSTNTCQVDGAYCYMPGQ